MSEQDISNEAILNLAAQLDREETTQFLADRFRALLMDRECLRGERDSARMMVDDMGLDLRKEVAILEIKLDWARDEREALRETLRDALDDVPGWVTSADALLKKGAP